MAKTKTETKRFFLRTGIEATDRMSADIDFVGVEARLLLNADHSVEVYKVLKNKKIGAKPIAKGKAFKHPLAGTDDKMPDMRAVVNTAKGSKVAFVGWKHDGIDDPYYVLQVDEFVRKGNFVDI